MPVLTSLERTVCEEAAHVFPQSNGDRDAPGIQSHRNGEVVRHEVFLWRHPRGNFGGERMKKKTCFLQSWFRIDLPPLSEISELRDTRELAAAVQERLHSWELWLEAQGAVRRGEDSGLYFRFTEIALCSTLGSHEAIGCPCSALIPLGRAWNPVGDEADACLV